jgi:hypothetical protein
MIAFVLIQIIALPAVESTCRPVPTSVPVVFEAALIGRACPGGLIEFPLDAEAFGQRCRSFEHVHQDNGLRVNDPLDNSLRAVFRSKEILAE